MLPSKECLVGNTCRVLKEARWYSLLETRHPTAWPQRLPDSVSSAALLPTVILACSKEHMAALLLYRQSSSEEGQILGVVCKKRNSACLLHDVVTNNGACSRSLQIVACMKFSGTCCRRNRKLVSYWTVNQPGHPHGRRLQLWQCASTKTKIARLLPQRDGARE